MVSHRGEAHTGCWRNKEPQKILPSLLEGAPKLRPKGELRAGERQAGGREWTYSWQRGFGTAGGRGRYWAFVEQQVFRLAEEAGFKAEKGEV